MIPMNTPRDSYFKLCSPKIQKYIYMVTLCLKTVPHKQIGGSVREILLGGAFGRTFGGSHTSSLYSIGHLHAHIFAVKAGWWPHLYANEDRESCDDLLNIRPAKHTTC